VGELPNYTLRPLSWIYSWENSEFWCSSRHLNRSPCGFAVSISDVAQLATVQIMEVFTTTDFIQYFEVSIVFSIELSHFLQSKNGSPNKDLDVVIHYCQNHSQVFRLVTSPLHRQRVLSL
jgi:hypothetical protein